MTTLSAARTRVSNWLFDQALPLWAERGVLFTGDLLFHGLSPLVFMGSVDGANRSLDWIASFGAAQVVPGHGPVISAAALPEVIAQLFHSSNDKWPAGAAFSIIMLVVALSTVGLFMRAVGGRSARLM